jgi:valyl-tRNA synthetase
MHLKKKYNHSAVESEFLKKKYFQTLYAHKKNTKRDTVITQLPINISKDTPLESVSDLINESVITTYNIMKGSTVKLLPIFDTDQKNLTTKNYENILKDVGIFSGIDIDNLVYSERNTNFVRNLFVELVEDGHIYEDCSINYRSINEQKTLGNDELQRKKMKIKEYHIRYFVDTKNISLVVPTLRPETIFGDVALAVHPDDKRYKKIIGQRVIIPIINRTIPIIGDESVDPTKGTGIIRITPTHDTQSLTIAKAHELPIDIYAIDKKGCFTTCAKEFCGKEIKEFVKNIIKNLDDIHNLESVHTIESKVAIHKKTEEKARPLLCNQLFIKKENENEEIQKSIQTQQLLIHPEYQQEIISTNINNIGTRPVTKEDSK